MTALRFCFLTTFYPPYNFGGDGIGIQRLARGLVRFGHHVTVVHDVDAYATLSPGPAPSGPAELPGIEVIPLRSRLGAVSVVLTQQTGRPVVHGRRIQRIVKDGRFDVINFHNVSLIGGPGILRYGHGIKLFMAHEHWLVCPTHVLWRHRRELCTGRQCLRCQIAYRRPPQLWRWTGFLDRQLDQVDTFIAMSEFSRTKHREFGFPRDMTVLPYFLPDTTDDSTGTGDPSPRDRPYFLFVGRLEQIKGVQDVIPMFEGNGAADLVIAGDGEFGSELRAQADGMARVQFLGRLPGEELTRYYRHAVALIVPSLCFETFGIILLEAFRQSTPVLARALGPLPEIVDTSGGGAVFNTRDELMAAMTRLLEDPGYRDHLGQAGHQALRERWSERTVVPKYLEIVREAAERRGDTRVVNILSARRSA
jgi:glycosyltransferase involved in cell wall biosynthesis